MTNISSTYFDSHKAAFGRYRLEAYRPRRRDHRRQVVFLLRDAGSLNTMLFAHLNELDARSNSVTEVERQCCHHLLLLNVVNIEFTADAHFSLAFQRCQRVRASPVLTEEPRDGVGRSGKAVCAGCSAHKFPRVGLASYLYLSSSRPARRRRCGPGHGLSLHDLPNYVLGFSFANCKLQIANIA